MAKSKQTFGKREKEKKRLKKREDKAKKKAERKANAAENSDDDMIMYVDEFGNFTSTPPDPTKKKKIKAEDIEIGVPTREVEEEDPVRTGILTFFNEDKGYGFIRDEVSQESIFTHINSHVDEIRERDRVTFLIEHTHKGPNAVEVRLVEK